MRYKFQKWQGCGNDFIVVPLNRFSDKVVRDAWQRSAEVLCSRDGYGVGADGILLVEAVSQTSQTSKLQIINSDGSVAAHCGNGTRCAAAVVKNLSIAALKDDHHNLVQFDIDGRNADCWVVNQSETRFDIRVAMGEVVLNSSNDWHMPALGAATKILADSNVMFSSVHTGSVGNKHVVVFMDQPPDKDLVSIVGMKIQNVTAANVHFVGSVPLDGTAQKTVHRLRSQCTEVISLQSYERGCGYTLACGSGATVAGVLAYDELLIERGESVAVSMPGGVVLIDQEQEGDPAFLTGPCQLSFVGELDL